MTDSRFEQIQQYFNAWNAGEIMAHEALEAINFTAAQRGGMAQELRSIAEDPELLSAAHRAIEDILVEWRNQRLSTPFVGNGLVIHERDGKPSSEIRLTPPEAMAIGLKAIADHLEGR